MTTTSELETKAVRPMARLTRRELLKGSGILIGMLSGASSALLALAPSRTWAVELGVLSEAQGQELMRFVRELYPHDSLDDAAYALVVSALDGAAKSDPATMKLLAEGLRKLDAAAGVASCAQVLASSSRRSRPSKVHRFSRRFAEQRSGPSTTTLSHSPISATRDRHGRRVAISTEGSTTLNGSLTRPNRRVRRKPS